MTDIKTKGLAELQRFLDQLPAKVERNVLRGALRAGANVLKPLAQAGIRSRSGQTARSIKVRSNARGSAVTASLYTSSFKARFLEYGTKPHRIEPKNRKALSIGGLYYDGVNHPGARPYPFLRPAMDQGAPAAVVAVGEYMKNRLATKEGLDTSDIIVEVE